MGYEAVASPSNAPCDHRRCAQARFARRGGAALAVSRVPLMILILPPVRLLPFKLELAELPGDRRAQGLSIR